MGQVQRRQSAVVYLDTNAIVLNGNRTKTTILESDHDFGCASINTAKECDYWLVGD